MITAGHVPVSIGRGLRDFALVDEDDVPTLLRSYWQVGTDGYARRKATLSERAHGAPRMISMHRFLLGLHSQAGRPGMPEVDHINRNRLDNRRANLRLVNRAINSMNRAGGGIYSRYVGVSFFKPARLWRAYIQVEGKRVDLGYFKTEYEAALARDDASRRHYGALAVLNLPGAP